MIDAAAGSVVSSAGCPPRRGPPGRPLRRTRAAGAYIAVAAVLAVGCRQEAAPTPEPVAVYTDLLERQKALIEAAFATIDQDALAHKRGFRDQVVAYMQATYDLEVGAEDAATEAGEAAADGEATADGDAGPDLGSFLIFAARPDALPRGYWQPGVAEYRPFRFGDIDAARAFIAERVGRGENLYLRAAPASAAALDERLVFSEYPAIAMTSFHEALHNRIQVPLAVEEPLHTLLALALTDAFARALPTDSDADQRLAAWLIEGSAALRRRYAERAERYVAFLAELDPDHPDPAAINAYARGLLEVHRQSQGSEAQRRYGRAGAAPYASPSLVRDLRVIALEPAEQGLLGTALVADYSTYERRFGEVHALLEPHLEPDRIARTLDALLDHQVPEHDRYAFDPALEDQALAWLASALPALD